MTIFDFKHTRLLKRIPLADYGKVRAIVGSIVRSRSLFIDKRRLLGKDYLDIGCGSNTHSNFINLDYAWHPGIDICWDITSGIPLPDDAVQGAFTEHCIEHLSIDAADSVLAELRRVIMPGGSVRIIVPDGELYLTSYADNLRSREPVPMPLSEGDAYKGMYSPIMSVNRIFRDHGHLFIHDFQSLRQLLQRNGFIDVKRERFKKGRDPKMLIDTEGRRAESLYVEAAVP
jgi:predicted SAM-dependent methyltransferase